jgi:hypothetical protein
MTSFSQIMPVGYLRLRPESALPNIPVQRPFRSIVVIEADVASSWRSQVSTWLVKSGCLYMMAWGNECSIWDDAVDLANIEEYDYENIPEENLVLTTWHKNESLQEVFWYSKSLANHPAIEQLNTLILHIAKVDKKAQFLSMYNGEI